jgi:dihydrofolate synthase/folylpolyglutamate synthase
MLKDKDIGNTLEILASDFERFYACSLPSERGATKESIKRSLVNCGVDKSTISMFKNVSDAYEIALVELPEDADLYIFGSFLTVDAILKYEEDRVKPI